MKNHENLCRWPALVPPRPGTDRPGRQDDSGFLGEEGKIRDQADSYINIADKDSFIAIFAQTSPFLCEPRGRSSQHEFRII